MPHRSRQPDRASRSPTQSAKYKDTAMPKVLISDKLSPAAVEIFRNRGIEVDLKPGLSPADLRAIIADYDGLAIRSATKVTKELLDVATKLKVVGRAGLGVDGDGPNYAEPAASRDYRGRPCGVSVFEGRAGQPELDRHRRPVESQPVGRRRPAGQQCLRPGRAGRAVPGPYGVTLAPPTESPSRHSGRREVCGLLTPPSSSGRPPPSGLPRAFRCLLMPCR